MRSMTGKPSRNRAIGQESKRTRKCPEKARTTRRMPQKGKRKRGHGGIRRGRIEEARPATPARDPGAPIEDEYERQMLRHMSYRVWRPWCITREKIKYRV